MKFALAAVLLALGVDLAAAELLKASITPLAPRSRDYAPEWVEVRVQSGSTAVREGVFEFSMVELGGETTYRYRTHELAIGSGLQRFRFLLPPSGSLMPDDSRGIAFRFIEKDRSVDLGIYRFPALSRLGRNVLLGVVRTNTGPSVVTQPLWQMMQLERMAPEAHRSSYVTTPAYMEPEDLSPDPLGLCAYDGILLEQGAFTALREKTRAALGQWISSGGTALIVAGTGMQAASVDALNQLLAGDPSWDPLVLGADGKVAVPNGMVCARANFGHIVVVGEPPADQSALSAPEWRNAAARFWRVNPAQFESIIQTGTWKAPDNEAPGYDQSSRDKEDAWGTKIGRYARYRTGAQPPPFGQTFTGSVRMIPRPLIAVLMIGFVLAIGPGDWFLLGALRRRKLTWVLLPTVTLLVTGITIVLARFYIGDVAQRGAVVIHDIGVNGRVLRTTRFESELPARRSIGTWPTASALRVPLTQSVDRLGHTAKPVEYAGQFPARFTMSRSMGQWQPLMMRVTQLTDLADPSGIKWDAFDPTIIEKDEERVGAPSRARAKTRILADRLNPEQKHEFVFFHDGKMRSHHVLPVSRSTVESDKWRAGITGYPTRDPARLLAQFSPLGSALVDDLVLLAPGDVSRTVVVATTREGAETHVWRRLYLH